MTLISMKPKLLITIAWILLLVLANVACTPTQQNTTSPEADLNPQSDDITISYNGLLAETPLDDLVKQADLIIIGEVLNPLPPQANTPDGLLPNDVSVEQLPENILIFTDVPIRVEELMKGTPEDETVIVRLFGGSIGKVSMEVDYEPSLVQGQRVLLFLTKEDVLTGNVGQAHYKVIAAPSAFYEIVGDNAVTRSETVSLNELLTEINTYIQQK